ncbi:MAG: chemotaxis protein, partial [Sulfurimonas sp.]
MFKNLSIYKKMNYFIVMVTVSVFSAALAIFLAMEYIESKYNHLHHNSMIGGLTTLKIEINLNYVSRLSRDIMLGGDYDKNIEKLDKTIKDVQRDFNALEELMREEPSFNIVKEANNSTMLFLNNTLKMMKSLSSQNINENKDKIYSDYSSELTPFANTSRESFKKLVELKAQELEHDSSDLGTV